MRRVDAITIIKRIEVKQPEFLCNLYRVFDLMDLDKFYCNKYVCKWIAIEDRFGVNGIDASPKEFPRGLAVNFGLIKEYLDVIYMTAV